MKKAREIAIDALGGVCKFVGKERKRTQYLIRLSVDEVKHAHKCT